MINERSSLRGHKIIENEGVFRFADTGESTVETWEQRPCGYCGLSNTIEGHDGCLGTLEGVVNACCGHGCVDDAYVQFCTGEVLRKGMAARFFEAQLKKEASRIVGSLTTMPNGPQRRDT